MLTFNSRMLGRCGVGRDQDSVACGCLFDWPGCDGRSQGRNSDASSERKAFSGANDRWWNFFIGYLDQIRQTGHRVCSRPDRPKASYAGGESPRRNSTATFRSNFDHEYREPALARSPRQEACGGVSWPTHQGRGIAEE